MKDITIQNYAKSLMDVTIAGKPTPQSHSVSFGQMLNSSFQQVNRMQKEADARIHDLAAGKKVDIHQTMIAVEKASVSFELLMQVRNKVISAYESIMRLSV